MKTRDKILRYIQKNEQSTIHSLANDLKISRQYAHRIISELEETGLVKKMGIPPKVYYSILAKIEEPLSKSISYEQERFLQEHFIVIDALGQLLEGLIAMKYWCSKQNLLLNKTIEEFISTRKKYLEYYNPNFLVDGLSKLKGTNGIEQIGVDCLFYLDFYAIERFGKTRLGTLMHYAKQGQNKFLMKIIVNEIKQRIVKLIEEEAVTAILYVPPTIKRKIQIMDFLKTQLAIDLPSIKVEKIKTQIIVPQKALSKIFERVANAKNTFIVPRQQAYEHVLIIDDAIGSGATINEIAIKIKDKKLANKITGLSITGSYKGFEVISEL
jgi:DNA-binding MarR family transcriptional regulator